MTSATLEAWLNAVNPASRPAEQKAFLQAVGREDDTLLANAVREYLGNPDRRGRPTIADLQRTIARLRGNAASHDQTAVDERLVHGGVPERMGFRFDSTYVRADVPPQVVANWFREYADLQSDMTLWAHFDATEDPVIVRMRRRYGELLKAFERSGWVREFDAVTDFWAKRPGRQRGAT